MQREAVCRQGEQHIDTWRLGREYQPDIHSLRSPTYHTHAVRQTYGKGSAADCRRHVQKLNMLRGEREQMENEQIQSSHPPNDYADAFTTQDKQLDEIVSLESNKKTVVNLHLSF